MNHKLEIQNKLVEIGDANSEINSITIVSDQGLILAQYNIDASFDQGEQNRLGAMMLACQALTNKTLGSLSYDQCKIFTVKAENANTGMVFSDKYSVLIIADPNSDIKSIASSTFDIIQQLMEN